MLMLPRDDPTLLAAGASLLDRAVPASIGRVEIQDQSIFLGRERVG
jgi:hypothetical protein